MVISIKDFTEVKFHLNFPKKPYINVTWPHGVRFAVHLVFIFKVVSDTATSLQKALCASSTLSLRKKPTSSQSSEHKTNIFQVFHCSSMPSKCFCTLTLLILSQASYS